MTPELWRRVDETFHLALEQPEETRQTWVEKACAGDAELLGHVQGMLSADQQGGLGFERNVRRTAAALLLSSFGGADLKR